MNAKYKNLYQELVSRDMTDLDENSFYNEYSQNDNKFSELYSYLDSNEMTDLDPETFKLEYFGTPIIKKKRSRKYGFRFGSWFIGAVIHNDYKAIGAFYIHSSK